MYELFIFFSIHDTLQQSSMTYFECINKLLVETWLTIICGYGKFLTPKLTLLFFHNATMFWTEPQAIANRLLVSCAHFSDVARCSHSTAYCLVLGSVHFLGIFITVNIPCLTANIDFWSLTHLFTDGSTTITTPVDVIFLLLPYLIKAHTEKVSHLWFVKCSHVWQ